MRVRELRLKKKMKTKELADALGLKEGSVVNWEKDIAKPSKENITKLCQIFGVTAEYLMEPSEQEQELLAAYHRMTHRQRKMLVDLAKEFRQPKELKD